MSGRTCACTASGTADPSSTMAARLFNTGCIFDLLFMWVFPAKTSGLAPCSRYGGRRRMDATASQVSPFPARPAEPRFPSAEEVHRKARAAQHGVARLGGLAQHARHIDAHQVAAPLLHLAGDEDGIDMPGIHDVHDRAGGIVEWPDIEPVGGEHDDVGVLPRRERADLVLEPGAARALDGGELEHIAAGQERRQVLLAVAGTL